MMNKRCLYLSVAFVVLQGQGVFGREPARIQATSAPAILSPGMSVISDTKVMSDRKMLAQSNAAPSPAQPATQAGATLPSQRTETINYENWILTCREFLEGPKKRTCSATVAVQRTETGQTVLALAVQPNDQGKMTASIQIPSGVAIAPGIDVKFDKAFARKFAFDFCEPSRCSASFVADSTFIQDLSAAASVKVTLQSSDGKPVNFEFPVKGFDKAYAKMTKG
jgi:invasion protein IalB